MLFSPRGIIWRISGLNGVSFEGIMYVSFKRISLYNFFAYTMKVIVVQNNNAISWQLVTTLHFAELVANLYEFCNNSLLCFLTSQ